MSGSDDISSLDPRIAEMPFNGDQIKIILDGLDSGVAKSQSPSAYAKGYTDALSAAMSNMRPDTRARFAAAIDGNDKSAAATILDEGIAEAKAKLRKQIDTINLDDKNLKEKQDVVKRHLGAAEEVQAMATEPTLQRLGESCFHKFMEAWQQGDVITGDENISEWLALVERTIPAAPNVFVIQHDWAAAFQNATDFAEGEIRIPYTETVFEFRIAGRRLHFVRGHWRHYANSKTWIRWFLRGDPDLGFIDKHYKL